ncbi:MAG TPA: copper chaperone PCu(A)C [Woeseiaceae bacterium]|jgi:copper(I)-binding protein/cytochrome oxidase Cu insertion factor (SCO1/SenC/PrrC family)|nr:copper chaperone PCu(A)C [Woeseiaceae bacterium]
MRESLSVLAIAAVLAAMAPAASAASPWGANYFPNVPLITQDGETVRFFDDLIEDKIVAINFIYTTCVDSCPLETAQLVKVQQILGDRLGKDVYFYSISIDPDHDTPTVLKEYKERFGAEWTFLTGDEDDIISLRRKLGLYVEEIQDGSNNHNVNMIIGNQSTGRWMKRSPFENPYVLAEQIGNWLTDWKTPPKKGLDYASAPKLRDVPPGERLFRTRCATCHTVTGDEAEDALGPDLLGVTERRELDWLINWLRAPDQMLASKDPIALALYEKYNKLAMPNMRLNRQEAMDLLSYLDEESRRVSGIEQDSPPVILAATDPLVVAVAAGPTGQDTDAVAIMNAWIRETDAGAKANAGYMTLVNVAPEDLTLVSIESAAFDRVEMHEMATVDGLMKMREIDDLVIPANGQVKFSPGGKHLMMIGPRERLTAGHTVDLILVFESGARQKVTISVADQ